MPTTAAKLGVNVDDMLISQPDSGEQALEIAEALVRSNGVDVIVVDSVAALVPRAELDGEMGDSLPGLQARLMSQALRKLTAIVAQSNTCFIFINQIRENDELHRLIVSKPRSVILTQSQKKKKMEKSTTEEEPSLRWFRRGYR